VTNREFCASLAVLFAAIGFVVWLFVGRPTWLTLILFIMFGVGIPVVWIEQKKRGHR
jgi:hypothetical protein